MESTSPCNKNIPNFFIKSTLAKIRSCKSSELRPELVPNFAQFLDTLKMGMKQGLEGETKAQTQDDFRDDRHMTHYYCGV
jgi:hypothetical protein